MGKIPLQFRQMHMGIWNGVLIRKQGTMVTLYSEKYSDTSTLIKKGPHGEAPS